MGALTDALAEAARDGRRGARHRPRGARGSTTDGTVRRGRPTGRPTAEGTRRRPARPGERLAAGAGRAARRRRRPPPAEGAQLKVNMLLRRLPRLRDTSVDPREAFAGTFHIAEGYGQLAAAYAQAAAGELPAAPPSEIYCHSLTDPTILGPDLVDAGLPDAHPLRPAHPGPAVRRRQRRRTRGTPRRPPSPSSTPTWPSRSPTAWPPTPTAAPASRRRPRSTWSATCGCPAATSSTATSSWPYAAGGHRPLGRRDRATPTSCCAARARCAAAGSAGSRATTRRWRSWRTPGRGTCCRRADGEADGEAPC